MAVGTDKPIPGIDDMFTCICGQTLSNSRSTTCDACDNLTWYHVSDFGKYLKLTGSPTADDYVKDIKDQIRDHPRFELNREPDPSDNADFTPRATGVQIGGSHYKNMPIQPVKFITANDLGFCEGNVVKYICRYKEKGQVEDLQKAKHYIDLLIESME